jgi:hypothetical protein
MKSERQMDIDAAEQLLNYLNRYLCWVGNTQGQVVEQKRVNVAFVLSIVSGALILLQGALRFIRSQWGLELGIGEFRRHTL